MEHLIEQLSSFPRKACGASAAEYALIIGIIVIGITGATLTFGGTLGAVLADLANCVETACT